MFDDNTHAWQPLQEQTIQRKKREKSLFRQPESINIRKGGLFNTFTNNSKYQVQKSNQQIDFNISLDSSEQNKTSNVAKHSRNVVEVTQNELDQITDELTKIITDKLRQTRL